MTRSKRSRKDTKNKLGDSPSASVNSIRFVFVIFSLASFVAFSQFNKGMSMQQIIMDTLELQSEMPSTLCHETSPRSDNTRFSRRRDYYNASDDRSLLAELTESPPMGSIACPEFTTPIYDRILEAESGTDAAQKIPKIVHLSFTSRCVGEALSDSVQKWKEGLPDYSIYFHDDHAVDRLLQQDWPEFPDLHQKMLCIKYKGAMKTDLWRMLVAYRFGGIYTDIDNIPAKGFRNGTIINPDDTFFASSDDYSRPTQNAFAIEPQHPIAVFTIQIILRNLMSLESLRDPKLVFVTGPHALLEGCAKFVGRDNCTNAGIHTGKFMNKKIHRVKYMEWRNPLNEKKVTYNGQSMTMKQRDYKINGIEHWQDLRAKNRRGKDFSCLEYLYRVNHPSKGNIITGNWSLNAGAIGVV